MDPSDFIYVIRKIYSVVIKLFKMLPQKIQEKIIRIPEDWKTVNEYIKRKHFLSMLSQEMIVIDKEKNSILEHAGLDGLAKNAIRTKLMEKEDELYSTISKEFVSYYFSRQFSISVFTIMVLAILGIALLIYQSVWINFSSEIPYANVTYVLILIVGVLSGLAELSLKIITIVDFPNAILGNKIRKSLRTIIRFELRKIVNDLFFPLSYASILAGVKGAGLEEGYDRLVEVDTAARHYVQKMISKMNHGSFGVAGPRGTGKTTLLHSIQEQAGNNTIYVHVSAPVVYDAREYILYLYAEICRAVTNLLDPLGKEQPHVGGKWSLRKFFWGVFRWEIILAAFITATVVFYRSGVVMEYYQEILKSYTIDADVLDIILKYNFLLVFLAFLILVFFFNVLSGAFKSIFLYLFPETKNRQTTLKRAYNELQKIKYQQTLSDAKGGKLNLSIFEASSDQSSTFQEYEMSLPEVTNAYRKFIAEMAGRYRFIIAIDEMDKIEDSLQAQAFLNDLKNILNLENCFYLVSVSENAMSAFELRGLPFRDAFDSTFDEVVHLNYIDLRQTREIISRRLIGFPEPFLQLAYALSGGLPRDLIRITRKMVMSVSENKPAPQLSDVSYMLLREDLVNKINAVRHQVQEKGLNIKAGSYMLALDVLETNISVDNLNKQGKSLIKSARGFTQKNGLVEIQALFYNLGIYMLYISTLLAFFTQSRTEDEFKLAADSHLDQLVTARQRIGLSSDYALILINQFRKTFRMPVVKA